MTSRPALASKTKERLPQWHPPTKRCAALISFGGLLAARLLRFVFVVLLNGLHRGRHGGADETLAVVARPIIRGLARDIGFVDDGRHMPLPEFIGFLGGLEVRPIVRELQEATEFALLLLQAADLRDGIVRRADDDHAVLDELFGRFVGGRLAARDTGDVREVVLPLLEAEFEVLEGL